MSRQNLHSDPEIITLGTCPTRSYYIPYADARSALNGEREQSDQFTLLSGREWDFKYYEHFDDVPDDVTAIDGFEKLTVPSMWQMHGYGSPQYINHGYAFPFDPPYLPADNPCGVYRTTFTARTEGKTYLIFEGVDPALYVYINGQLAGYFEISHIGAEIDITAFVKEGENTLTALLPKWCTGCYFEDQDKWRMTGIFRDVYLLHRPTSHIGDLEITYDVGDFSAADICIKATNAVGTATLFLPDGTQTETVRFQNDTAHFHLTDPVLWNAEAPYRYTVLLQVGGEYIAEHIALRRVEIRNSVLRLNGAPIKFKGVNRHDFNARTGFVCSFRDLCDDVKMMKEHNVNAVRTSHYPNDPRFLEICEREGLYVIDEADLETHGCGTVHSGGVHDLMPTFADNPKYYGQYKARVLSMIERDKNRGCILIWSMGNEAGWGINFQNILTLTKKRDPSRLTHYEGQTLYERANGVRLPPYSEFYSRMYASLSDCRNYLESDDPRPYMQCEYSHAMGAGPGDLDDYAALMYRYEKYCGGFVWEWFNHGLWMGKTTDGKDRYGYGGDFGEAIHDGNFCMDGLVQPDRTPTPGLKELKQVYCPIDIRRIGDNRFAVTNRYDFTDTDAVTVVCERWDSDDRQTMTVPMPHIAPHQTVEITLPAWRGKQAEYVLFTVGNDQGTLGRFSFAPAWKSTAPIFSGKAPIVRNDGRYLTLSGDGFCYRYDTGKGMFCSLVIDGTEYLQSPMELTVFRAYTDNERKVRKIFEECRLHLAESFGHNTSTALTENGVTITTDFSLAPPSLRPLFTGSFIWTVSGSGQIDCRITADIGDGITFAQTDDLSLYECYKKQIPFLPRFGIQFALPKSFDTVHFVGKGPLQSYSDFQNAACYGNFTMKTEQMYFHYIKPQENGNHHDTRQADIVNAHGRGLGITADRPFDFSVKPYADKTIYQTAHDFDLPPSDGSFVHIDYGQSGLGSASCGPKLEKKYALCDEHIEFHFTVRPIQ